MSPVSSIRDRAYAEAKRLCYMGLDEETLLRETLEVAQRVVPFEMSCIHANDPASGLITKAVHSDPEHQKIARIALERVYFEDEVTPFDWMAKRGLLAVSLSAATGGRRGSALRYRELMVPFGLEYELRSVFVLHGELWGSMTAMRERNSPDFDERDVAFFKRIAPHVATGLKMSMLRSESRANPNNTASSPGVLALDQSGRITQYTPAAKAWLEDLCDLRPDWQEGAGLPAAITSAIGALEHSLGMPVDRDQGVTPGVLVRGKSGSWLKVYAAQTESGCDVTRETMVVIHPAGTGDIGWLRTSAYGLTAREREVVELVARGSSTRQISDSLYISEYTVQEHLSNVFEKVGVQSRRELVKHLYLDSIL